MKNSKIKALAVTTLAGTVLGGGCLGLNWQNILWQTAIYAGTEFVLDNDGVFDLFEDGNVTAAG